MKKLLILMLVLGITSAANATVLEWSTNAITIDLGDPVAVVQLIASDDQPYAAKWVGNDPSAIAEITSISALTAAGPDAVVKDPSVTGWAGWWTVEALDFDPTTWDVSAGSQYTVTITGLAEGVYTIDSDSYSGTNDVLTITVIPEPMTVALLGLGGLFLLRRRK